MSPKQALQVLRNLVCDGVRAFDCQKALKTLETAVLAQQTNNSSSHEMPSEGEFMEWAASKGFSCSQAASTYDWFTRHFGH